MNMSFRVIAAAGVVFSVTLTLGGCGSSSSSDATASSPTRSVATPASSEPGSSETASSEASLVKVGFGQQGEYVWSTALVKNESDNAGQTVTVHFNLKDANGKVVASGDQVSGFNWGGQEVPIATQIDVPKHVQIASVDATVDVEDDGIMPTSDDWGTVEGELVREYGDWQARFTVQNPTDQPLKGSALQVICVNAAGDIIGGSSAFPELIPASGVSVVETFGLYTDEKPASCTGYLTPWM